MDYETFTAHAEHCKKIWQDFKDSFKNIFTDDDSKNFLKNSYAVLSYSRGQVSLGSADFYAIATESPGFFLPNKASSSLIGRVRTLEMLKKDSSEENKKDREKIEMWLKEFDPARLKLEESQLEVRFPSLKMDLIQRIKQSPFVCRDLTGTERVSIRVVLRVP